MSLRCPSPREVCILHPPSLPHLYHLPRRFLVCPQHRPAISIHFHERELYLCAQNPVFALLGLDASVQWELGLVALAILRAEVELDALFLEGDG